MAECRHSRAALRWLCAGIVLEGLVAAVSAAGFAGLGLWPSTLAATSHAIACWCLAALGLRGDTGEGMSFLAKGAALVMLGLWRLLGAVAEDCLYGDAGRAAPPPPPTITGAAALTP